MQTFENECKEQKKGFIGILLATLYVSLLGDPLACKGVIRTGERTVTVWQEFHVASSFG